MLVLCLFIVIVFLYYLNKLLQGNKKGFRVIIITISVLIIWFMIFNVDLYRSKNHKKPIFASNLNGLLTYQDGGTTVYYGIGYKVYSFNTTGLRCNVMCSYFTSYDKAKAKVIESINY